MPNIVTFSLAFKHNLHLVTFFSLPICIVFPQFTGKFIDLFQVIGSSRILAGSKEKNSFYCTVSIFITFNCRNVK